MNEVLCSKKPGGSDRLASALGKLTGRLCLGRDAIVGNNPLLGVCQQLLGRERFLDI